MTKTTHIHDIGAAISHIQTGGKIQRKGWHGKGMAVHLEERGGFHPAMVLTLPDGSLQPGWNASTPDILATDWGLL